jgi:hypothetical protein
MFISVLNRAFAAVIIVGAESFALSTPAMAASPIAGCTAQTLTGVYTYAYTGYSIASDQTHIPFTTAGLASYDGYGHIQGVSTTTTTDGKPSIAKSVPYKGYYTIAPDCQITEVDIDATGAKSRYDEYTGPAGDSIRFVESDLQSFSAGAETRD